MLSTLEKGLPLALYANLVTMTQLRSDSQRQRRSRNSKNINVTGGKLVVVEFDKKKEIRIADLFSGSGGAAMGLHRAFTGVPHKIVGFDILPMPRYPAFHDAEYAKHFEFHQQDALTVDLSGFDAVWASPPCQAYTPLRARYPEKTYPDLIGETRDALRLGVQPWIIENVMPAPIGRDAVLCGTMFGLRVYRHRRFEASDLFMFVVPEHPRHKYRTGSGHGQTQRKAHYLAGNFVTVTGNVGSYAGAAMGIDWMTGAELSQAIPPAYSEYLGRQLLAAIDGSGEGVMAL